jgi:hypothetical protein
VSVKSQWHCRAPQDPGQDQWWQGVPALALKSVWLWCLTLKSFQINVCVCVCVCVSVCVWVCMLCVCVDQRIILRNWFSSIPLWFPGIELRSSGFTSLAILTIFFCCCCYFIYLYFKCYLPSRFPIHTPPITFFLFPDSMTVCPPPHLFPPHHDSIRLFWGIESPQDWRPPLLLIPDKTYAARAMGPSMCIWLVI